jgi:hypothetical protein
MILKKIIVGCVVIITCVILLIALVLFFGNDPFNLRAPKDQNLINLFKRHRDEFEQLRQMVLDDSTNTQYFSSSTIDNSNLSESRKKMYKHLLDSISAGLVLQTNLGQVSFCFAGGGLSLWGPEWSKGIIYAPYLDKATIIEPDLENWKKTLPGFRYVRPIEVNWFVYYQRFDD